MPDSRLKQGYVLLVSPAYWISSDPPEDIGMPSLETKPLLALLTAMVLAGLRNSVIHPEACDIESLGQGLSSTVKDSMRSSETEDAQHGGTFGEHVRRHHITPSRAVSELWQVLAFSYDTTGISSTSRILRRTRVQPLRHQQGFTPQPLITPLPTSSPDLPGTRAACPALGALPNPPELPEPRHSLVLHEHVPYAGCLEAWRGTLDQSKRVLAKLFLHEHVESAHCEAYAYERFLSVPNIEGVIVPRYWGTYTYRGEFYVIVLEDTGPKLKSFHDCNRDQRYDFRHYVRRLPGSLTLSCLFPCRETIMSHTRVLHNSGIGFPATASHFTGVAEGDLRIVDFGDSFEHKCDPETCDALKKLIHLLGEVESNPS